MTYYMRVKPCRRCGLYDVVYRVKMNKTQKILSNRFCDNCFKEINQLFAEDEAFDGLQLVKLNAKDQKTR